MSALEELKCKKCLARQRFMKYIKINKLNKLLSNKQIYKKWLKESVLGAAPTIG